MMRHLDISVNNHSHSLARKISHGHLIYNLHGAESFTESLATLVSIVVRLCTV